MRPFIGRKQELQLLENAYTSKNAFVMVNGRRRVGKTALVRHFLKGKRALYFTAKEEVDVLSRRRFLKTFAEYCGETLSSSAKLPDWKEIFKAFAERVETSRKVLVIDNVAYLMLADPSFARTLKYAWERYFKQASVMLIVVMPNNSLLVNLEGKSNTLIGCVTTQLKLKPISFVEMIKDYPHQDFNQLMTLYAIAGGVPKYWEFFAACEKTIDYMGVVREDMLDQNSLLYEEPMNLIERDVWEPSYYNAVLKAVADNYHRPADIARYLEMKPGAVNHCLSNLAVLGYLEARVPITEKKAGPSNRKVQYYFSDPFMDFWYTFIFENKEHLEAGQELQIFEAIKRAFPGYIQFWFKTACKEIFAAACKQGGIPFKIDRIGTFWNKNEETVDIVAVDEQRKRIFLGDCLYSNKPYTMEAYDDFVENCSDIREFKVFKDYDWTHGVFTANPFDPALMDYAMITSDVYMFNGITVYSRK